ncbi:MAG: WG repeat-containing protein [Bacteroidales bacterium]
MKKYIISIVIFLCLSGVLEAQEYISLMQQGKQNYNNQNYIPAFELFDQALEIAKSDTEIKDAKNWKNNCMKNIRKEMREADQWKKELKQSKEILESIYFYDNKFALACKDGKFGFIDKNGKVLIDFRYDNAVPFDIYTGFARAAIGKTNYLLDSTGREYLLSETSKGLAADIEAIDLSRNQLTEIPKEIFNCHHLKILIISHNNLKKIPLEINRLKELVFLDLSGNALLGLSADIGALKNLKYLNLRENFISKLPNEISNLQQLEKLDISNNQLFKLPDGLASLYNLKALLLDGNQLQDLSADIGLLINLKFLSVQGNLLTNLPPEIGRLSRLNTLCLNNNKITDLPVETGRLLSLQNLYMAQNQLMFIPEQIKQLELLRGLDLRGNSINDQRKEMLKKWLPACEIQF